MSSQRRTLRSWAQHLRPGPPALHSGCDRGALAPWAAGRSVVQASQPPIRGGVFVVCLYWGESFSRPYSGQRPLLWALVVSRPRVGLSGSILVTIISLEGLPWLSADACDVLCSHDWPGNVRELENVMQRALVLQNGGVVDAEDIVIDMVPVLQNVPTPQSSQPTVSRLSAYGG